MAPVIPLLFCGLSDQTQVGFMDQRGCGQGLSGGFVRELLSRQSLEFGIDDRQQLIGGCQILLPGPVRCV